MGKLQINKHSISSDGATYFIADIAANHDGDLKRAFKLIELAKTSGADAVKFQHFRAAHIVSDYGFRSLGSQQSHQSKWKKSVFEVYQDASLDWEWTAQLSGYCKKFDIDFFSSPYDIETVDHLDPYVPAYKVGSGDITWPEILQHMAQKGKPIILATGASTLEEVKCAVQTIEASNRNIAIMQCNTNYTGSQSNFAYISLNVLKSYRELYPEYILGLSDHTPGHSTVLGAVTLGARIVEKHFTDDTKRVGPDHGFSMDPQTWRDMVNETRNLELALGSEHKQVEENEKETIVLQRRCLRVAKKLPSGHVICRADIEVLRPAPEEAIKPYDMDKVIGREIRKPMELGEIFTQDNLL